MPLAAMLRLAEANSVRLSNVDGPCGPLGMDPMGTGILEDSRNGRAGRQSVKQIEGKHDVLWASGGGVCFHRGS
jgi:hypothetical protein